LNFCPNCGVHLSAGQKFCTSCGFDLRPAAQAAQPASAVATPSRGLSRSSIVYATPDGLLGLTTHSTTTLFLAIILPLPFLIAAYDLIQAGSLDVYAVIWLAAAGLLYDELRWRNVRHASNLPATAQGHWFVPWTSILMADWNGRTLWFSSADPPKRASITFDRKDAPTVEWNLTSRGIRCTRKSPRLPRNLSTFWTLAILLFITSQAILILAATLPLFPGESQVYTTILNSTKSQVVNATFLDQFRAIYTNNIQVAWGGSLPVLGTIAFGVASYNTGRVIQVLAIGSKVPSAVVLLSLYVLPHTWFEEFSYPMAAAAGLLAITTWRSVSPDELARRRNRGSAKFILALGAATLTLAFAGFLEVLVGYLGLGVVLLWIPIGLGAFVALRWTRSRSRVESQTGSP
jgi:hypothetical protein